MLERSIIGLMAAFVLALAGCGAQPGRTVVKYEKGGETRMTTAPDSATYALYSTTEATPKVMYRLRRGDKLGFKEEGGTIYAVAGSNQETIDATAMARNWYWKKQKD